MRHRAKQNPELQAARTLAVELLEFAVEGAAGLSPAARAEYWRMIRDVVAGWVPQVEEAFTRID